MAALPPPMTTDLAQEVHAAPDALEILAGTLSLALFCAPMAT
jgi:hypothetical protein